MTGDAMSSLLAIAGALALLRAAGVKAARLEEFRRVFSAYDPMVHPRFAAPLWIVAEVVAAGALLVAWEWRYLPAAVVVGIATGAVSRRLLQGASHDCGCGGAAHSISSRILVRNGALVVAAAVLTFVDAGAANARTLLLAASIGALAGFASVGHSRASSAEPLRRTRPIVERVSGF